MFEAIRMKSAKNRKTELKLAAVFIAGVLMGVLFAAPQAQDATLPVPAKRAEIPLDGYEKVSVSMQFNDLIFSSQCYKLSMTVADTQTLSISYGIANTTYERPLTHDIMESMLENYGIETLLVKIESYSDGIYYAKIFLQQGNKVLELDSRPSDAAGLAVRVNAPVYFRKELLEQFGLRTC